MVSSTPSFTQPFNSFSALFFRSPVSCVYSLRRIIGRSSRNLSNLRRRSSTGISAECANPDFAFSTNPRTFFRKEDEDKQPLYPRIVSNGTIDFQRIVKEIAQASSFTPADIEGVQLAIENKISEYLISGYHVQLGDLGYFSAKLKARPVMDAKEIHAQSIYFDNVNFRPSSSFRKKVRGFVENHTLRTSLFFYWLMWVKCLFKGALMLVLQ